MAEKTIVAGGNSRAMWGYGSNNYTTQHDAATATELNATLYVLQLVSGGLYSISRVALIFDTSEIPAGCTITSVIMQIKPNIYDAEKNWDIVIRNGQPTYPHNPVVVGDYLYSHYSSNGGSVGVDTLNNEEWNDITLNSTGRGWIQKAGITKLVLISSKDISSTAPSTTEQVSFSYTDIRIVVTYFTAPTVTVQAPTSVNPTTATANGNITYTSGSNCTVRGFEYGLTKVNTWEAHDDGDFGTGAFTKALTGLSANTTYWIRAYATNPQGTSYSDWIQFQTAVSGVIPTGTRLFICSDYSACTYKLMRSETDDGETYTAYFVISTDLTEKQGLSFYKRILDLHLYFMSEDSGTADIEVKRDNEAEWQTVGTVSLTGTADIIIPHLAPDIRAKVFLFKISASNFFRFLGILFEYIPEDLR